MDLLTHAISKHPYTYTTTHTGEGSQACIPARGPVDHGAGAGIPEAAPATGEASVAGHGGQGPCLAAGTLAPGHAVCGIVCAVCCEAAVIFVCGPFEHMSIYLEYLET